MQTLIIKYVYIFIHSMGYSHTFVQCSTIHSGGQTNTKYFSSFLELRISGIFVVVLGLV